MRICDVPKCGQGAYNQNELSFPDYELCKAHYRIACNWFYNLTADPEIEIMKEKPE